MPLIAIEAANVPLRTRRRPMGKVAAACLPVTGMLLGVALPAPTAVAAIQYFAGDGSLFTASKYSAPDTLGPPYASAFVSGNVLGFNVANGTGAGGSLTVGGITADESFTLTAVTGTISTAANGVVPIVVAAGKTLDFNTQSFSTSATAGFTYNGNTSGVLALAGGTYGGGFTLTSGIVVARGVNAFGGNATAGPLNINGGTIAANATRDFATKFSSINIGGDFTLGATTAVTSLALSTANLTFGSPVALGSTTRTITLGGAGTYTFSGIVSGAGGITVNSAGNGGILALTTAGTNTFAGAITINSGAILSTNNTLAINGNATTNGLTINNGGTYRFTSTASYLQNKPVILGGGQDIIDVTGSGGQVALTSGITGSGTLVKTGIGSLSLNATNTFTGGINASAGILRSTTTGAIPAGTTALSGGVIFRYVNTSDNAGYASTRLFTLGTGGATFDFNNTAATTGVTQVVTISGVISDAAAVTAGGLTKTGISTLALEANNTYTGGTTISGGILQVGAGGTTGTAGTGAIVDNSTLAFNRTNTLAFGNAVSGTGTISQAGTGVTVLSGSNTYSGGSTVSAGTLEFQTLTSLPSTGSISVAAATVAAVGVGGAGQFSVAQADAFRASSQLAFAAGAFYGVDTTSATGDTNYNVPITNAGAGALGFAKIGTNNLVLTATNTYTGGTRVTGGSLVVGDGTTNGTIGSGAVAISSGASLVFDRSDTYTSPTGLISGAGSLVKNNTGTTILTVSSTYTGGTTINAGTLSVNNTGNLGGNTNPVVINAGTLSVTASISTGKPILLGAATSTYDVPNASSTVTETGAFTGTGTLNKTGAGVLALQAVNTYSGGTVISGGTLNVGTNGAVTGSLGSGPVTNNATLGLTVTSANGNVPIANAISGTGNLTKTGTAKVLLTGTNSYSGGSSITAGTLLANGSDALGTGTTVVSGTSTTAFGTLGGTGSTGGNVTVNNFGVITAGTGATTADTPGTLTTDDETWASGGKYVWKTLASTGTPGTTWDLINMGTLTGASGFIVQAIIGSGGSYVTPPLNSGTTTYQIAHTTNTSPIDVSGFVLNTSGLGVSPDSGTFTLSFDPSGGGGYDLNLNFNAAPEPTTAALFGLGGSALLGRRRRRGGMNVLQTVMSAFARRRAATVRVAPGL